MAGKIGTYLGSCKRAGKLALGVNAAAATRGRIYLFVADGSASPNTRKEIEKLAKRFSCPVVWTEGLGALVHKEHCKLAAVREEHLAAAILKETEDTKKD